jgi:hypothetical protein
VQPFLDLLHLESKETLRLWQSDHGSGLFESAGSLMSDVPGQPLALEGLAISLSRESPDEPPQS